MTHWDAVLPGKVLRVRHEEVVEDLEGSVRRVLAFCGLNSSPRACASTRPGAAEHRELRAGPPADLSEGMDQWRHFEPWLLPLRTALGELAEP